MKKAASDTTSPQSRKKAAADTPATTASKPPAPKARKATPSPAEAAPARSAAPAGSAATAIPESTTLTVVAARVDIGFGNHLYLRGSGPGLSWDRGTPMSNAGSDLWTIDLLGATSPICCKFLINDDKWSAGPDYVIDPGAQLEVTPLF